MSNSLIVMGYIGGLSGSQIMRGELFWIIFKNASLYGRLEESGWLCLVAEPVKANLTLVHKFYANATETKFVRNFVVIVRGKQVCFDPARINAYYSLPNVDNEVHKERVREEGKSGFLGSFTMIIGQNRHRITTRLSPLSSPPRPRLGFLSYEVEHSLQ
ncbi:hypothetical protein RDI58_024489 [Solanum bulbocastanum]|uniref:Uncharacterized protein n=1 Tax=Solanum bulbocastanum TaxID=147425 RepID=A0AAN8T5Z8_SOLBU